MLIRFFLLGGGCFPFVAKKSQVLIFPNFPRNARILGLLETTNTWIKLSDTGVNLRDERVVSLKLHK